MSFLADTTSGAPSAGAQQQVATPAPNAPNAPNAPDTSDDLNEAQQAGATQPTSRLQAIISAVAKVGETALSGIPESRRPSFVTGLGEGARAEQQAQATQNAIKFKSFDDQVRLAQLHNQDLKMQNDTQEQQDAHVKAELDNRALANSLGISYDSIASDGKAVTDHLTAQTAANGAASVPAGTHLSGDGETVNIPTNDQSTQDGQKQMYQRLAPALGLPALPQNAEFVPPQLLNMLTNKIHGYGIDGQPINHQDLPGVIGAEQAQRDQLAKNGGTPQQLQALDNRLAILKANLKALDDHANQQADLAEKRKVSLQDNASENKIAQQNNATTNKAQQSAGQLDSVAYDPNFQNPDGSTGANIVMSKADAQAKGLKFYKADPNKINAVVAGMNDVQNKLNQLATVTTDPNRMKQVQPQIAADMLRHGNGIEVGAFGFKVDTSTINADLAAADSAMANQATRDYVTAMLGAHEALTQLPRLQTFGQSSRMTEQQMQAAQRLLPQPGEAPALAAQKMSSLQGMIDPLRKQIPQMPGAEKTPSWLEQRKQQQQAPSGGSNLGRVVTSNPTGYINSFQ